MGGRKLLVTGIVAAVIVAVGLATWSVTEAGLKDEKVRKARRSLISLKALDKMTKLPGEIGVLPAVPVPASNPQTPAKIELGKQLFFDTRLSANSHWACATCHNPIFGYGDGLKRSVGFGDQELDRNSQTIMNIAYNDIQFWDGRTTTLEEQAVAPIVAAREMNSDPIQMIERISPLYTPQFMEVFGAPPTLKTIGMAIASFERTIITADSAFDRYMKGDKKALTKQEKRGLILFVSKASCTQCHAGPNFTDSSFHNLGLPQSGPAEEDLGRYMVTKDPEDKGRFKVPTVRNIEMTSPYMHTGSLATLEDVVRFYDEGGGPGPNKSPKLVKLNLNDGEVADLVAFMRSLTGPLPKIVLPELPRES